MAGARTPRKPKIEGWIRQLEGVKRLEIFLKVEGAEGQPDRKIRASGPQDEMLELVEWFEGKTGMHVESPILPRRVPKPIPGSLTFDLGDVPTSELESGDTDA